MTEFAEDMRGTSNRGVPSTPHFYFNPFPEPDYIDLLVGRIRKVMLLRNRDIRAKARAHVNA